MGHDLELLKTWARSRGITWEILSTLYLDDSCFTFLWRELVPFWTEPCEAMNAAAADLNAAQVNQWNNTAQWIIVLDECLSLFFCVQESLNACLKRQRSLIQLWAVVNVCGWVLKVLLVVHTNSLCMYSVHFSMVSFALHGFLLFFCIIFGSQACEPGQTGESCGLESHCQGNPTPLASTGVGVPVLGKWFLYWFNVALTAPVTMKASSSRNWRSTQGHLPFTLTN